MRQARHLVGPDVELYVDGGYRRKQAIRAAERVADLDVRWFEEPVSADDLAGLREVRDAVDADAEAGEYGYDLPYFERMCAAGAVDCLQADVTRCGGVTEWQRVAAVAAAHGLEISGHCAPACTWTWRWRPRTCGTWSGSTTTPGSSRWSSTACRCRTAVRSGRTSPRRATA